MIFYTLQGPSYELEIHDDKLSLIRKGWRTAFSKENPVTSWELQALSRFEITAPKFLLWGKIEWQTYDGSRGSFRFTTNPTMVKKIEAYMQKRILKDFHRHKNISGQKKAA